LGLLSSNQHCPAAPKPRQFGDIHRQQHCPAESLPGRIIARQNHPSKQSIGTAAVSAGRTIAIGDIHGCATALRTLLPLLELAAGDTLVMLGDAIDRGPNSRDVLEQLVTLGQRCQLVPILGNHEQMLLDVVDGKMPLQDWLIHGGAETLDSYGPNAALAEVPGKHIDLLCTWGDYHETDGHFFAHGNYLTKKKLRKQPWEEMRWLSLKSFLPDPHTSGKTAILGHTANKQGKIVNHGHLVCIDTYCHGGGWLTALEPVAGKVWQANERGDSRISDLQGTC
jgi:serine/threonine protein phosphatase 1